MTLSSPCRVAVVVPVYRTSFLHEAMTSVMAHTRPPDEVIVIDDGSPDRELIERVLGGCSRDVRLIRQCPSAARVTLEGLLAQTCNVLTSTVIVRRDLVDDAGGFDVALRPGQGFDLWLRLVARARGRRGNDRCSPRGACPAGISPAPA